MNTLSNLSQRHNLPVDLAIAIVPIMTLSFVLAALDGSGVILPGMLGYTLLLLLSVGGFIWIQRLVAANRAATKAAWVGFTLRLFIGIALMLILPLAGYQDNQASQAGYVFKDSFRRDTQAWELAQSNRSLLTAFSGEYLGDQYGGMLGLCALIYQLLEPECPSSVFNLDCDRSSVSLGGELIFTGCDIGAARAKEIGLVNDVLPDRDALFARARQLAQEIAANSPLAVQGSKQVLGFPVRREVDAALDYVALWNSAFLHSDDLTEAMRAFMERRKPGFHGR